jgi:TRAP-type C4-dicarboxylate transport system permease small subunit
VPTNGIWNSTGESQPWLISRSKMRTAPPAMMGPFSLYSLSITMRKPFRILLRTGRVFLDFVEIYLPISAFLCLFFLFVIQVFFRYFLNRPLTWPQELTSMFFVWTTLCGASYVLRKGDHVVFNLLYDRLTPPFKRITEMVGDALLITAFCIALVPSWEYVLMDCRSFIKTPALRIPYSIVYSPFVVCMPLFIIHLCQRFITNVIQTIKGSK